MLETEQNKRPFILNQLIRATHEEALEGTDEVKLITPATAKLIAGTGGGRNVFRSGGTPGSFTAVIDTNTFTIVDMGTSKDVDLVFNNLVLVNNVDYKIDKATGVVTLEFPIRTGETIYYEVISTSYSYNDLVDVPEGVVTPDYVDTKIAELVGSVPETLDTLKELGDALGNDPNFATTISNQIGSKADKVHNHQATQVTFTDGKTFEEKLADGSLRGTDGAMGPQGPKGDQGPQGATGATGPSGSPWGGGTFTDIVVGQSNTNYTTAQLRNTIISPSSPSGGTNGTIWLQYI